MTIKDVCGITGLTPRTLRFYDKTGLLKPSGLTEGGYRVYGPEAIERLRDIMLLREMEYPLSDIRAMLDSPDYDRAQALKSQIGLLKLKRARLDALIDMASGIISTGADNMDFSAFDKSAIDDYAAKARAQWGGTREYKEFEEKSKGRSGDEEKTLGDKMMDIFREFGALAGGDAASEAARALAAKLRNFITDNYYECSLPVLRGLADMYEGGGAFTQNIDAAGGAGTASFAAAAIRTYCDREEIAPNR